MLFLLAACAGSPRPVDSGPASTLPAWDSVLEAGAIAVHPDDDLAGLADLPCGRGEQCADGPPLGDTCCSFGDSLTHEGTASLLEPVDLEVDADRVYVCSGFGFRVAERTEPLLFTEHEARCQRIAIGPRDGADEHLVWFTHHGDTWVPKPTLWTYRITAAGPRAVHALQEPDVLYEGLRGTASHLYVATHAGGVRVYGLEDDLPVHRHTVDGFANAQKLALADGHLWVTDDTSIHVLSLADPDRPTRVSRLDLPGRPRDVDLFGDRAYVAMGSDGFVVLDADPEAPVVLQHVEPEGTVQAVAATATTLAVSNWSFASVYDRASLAPVGAEHVKLPFEEDLGIAAWDDRVYVAEWFGIHTLAYRPGWVAPDLYVPVDLVQVPAADQRTETLRLVNRGPLDLAVYDSATTDPAFAVDPPSLVIEAGGEATVELRYTPPAEASDAELLLATNDPDPVQNPMVLPLVVQGGSALDVGDTLTDDFAFLDPTGANDLDNLRGQVTVLAYFALF